MENNNKGVLDLSDARFVQVSGRIHSLRLRIQMLDESIKEVEEGVEIAMAKALKKISEFIEDIHMPHSPDVIITFDKYDENTADISIVVGEEVEPIKLHFFYEKNPLKHWENITYRIPRIQSENENFSGIFKTLIVAELIKNKYESFRYGCSISSRVSSVIERQKQVGNGLKRLSELSKRLEEATEEYAQMNKERFG